MKKRGRSYVEKVLKSKTVDQMASSARQEGVSSDKKSVVTPIPVSESDPATEVDDFKSPLFVNGFVIITPNVDDVDANDDELPLAGWISDRLLEMKITPTIISLNALREFSQEKTKDTDNEFEQLMGIELEDGCPLWKHVVKKGMCIASQPPSGERIQSSDSEEVLQLYRSFKEALLSKMESHELVWVLIVPNEFKSCVEVDMLHVMADQYDFRVLALSNPYKSNILRMLVAIAERKEELVWQTESVKEVSKERNDEAKGVSRRHHSKKSSKSKRHKSAKTPKGYCKDIQTLHKESFHFQLSPRNASLEKIMIEDYENDDNRIPAYPESIKSDDSDKSSTFEMNEANLFMCLSQAAKTIIPPPLNPKEYFREPSAKENSIARSLVIIIRDMMGCNNNSLSLARTIKERLNKMTVKSYVITVPSILKDLQAVRVTKEHAVRISLEKDKDLLDGYVRLILAIIANKMANKTGYIIIIDIGDETPVRLWPVKDFCMRLHAEIFTLDSLPEEQFESNLSKVIHEVSKRYKEMDWTTPVPIYDDNENLENSQNLPVLPDPEFLLSLERKEICEEEKTDDEATEGSISESLSESALSALGVQRTAEINEASVLSGKHTQDSEGISGDKSDFEETSSLRSNRNKSATNKTKRRKTRKALDRMSTISTAAKPKTSSTANAREKRSPIVTNDEHLTSGTDDTEKNRMNEIFSPKLNLLLIQKIPDDSRYPSRLSSKLIEKDISNANCDEDTYKGWVAVANASPDKPVNKSTRNKFRSKSKIRPDQELSRNTKDGLFKRLLRPIGLFITCQYCRSSRNSELRVSPEERLGYKGISLENAHPF